VLRAIGETEKPVARPLSALAKILPRRTEKRVSVRFRQPLVVLPQPNVVWAVVFMSDTLYGGERFRTFNILDEGVREVLVVEVYTSLSTEWVSRVLKTIPVQGT
jgi:putative transposase